MPTFSRAFSAALTPSVTGAAAAARASGAEGCAGAFGMRPFLVNSSTYIAVLQCRVTQPVWGQVHVLPR